MWENREHFGEFDACADPPKLSSDLSSALPGRHTHMAHSPPPLLHRPDLVSRFAFCSASLFGCVFRFSPALFVQSIRFLRAGAAENLPMIHFFSLASFPDSW